MNAAITGGKVTPAALDEARQAPAIDLARDSSASDVAPVLPDQFQTDPIIILRRDIAKDDSGFVDMIDDDVEPPVIVEIPDRQSAALVRAAKIRATARSRDVKVPIAAVAQ